MRISFSRPKVRHGDTPEVAVLAVLYEVEVDEELGHVDAAEDVLGVAHDVPEEGGDEDTEY